MNTHDVLAFAIATEAVRRLRAGSAPWSTIFSADTYVTSSRAWPVPDFVIVDNKKNVTIAAEFKPPQQTKREYLTGLGQAVSYTKDFNYALLVVPTIADDGFRIADHIVSVASQDVFRDVPVGILSYDPAVLGPSNPGFQELHFLKLRASTPAKAASLDQSFYAKWREAGPEEIHRYIEHSFDEMRIKAGVAKIRERAFDKLWDDIQAGKLRHWGGDVRHYTDTPASKVAVHKNYRNFLFHMGWVEPDGALTSEGFAALEIGSLYGPTSRPFHDAIAKAALLTGKHLILFNAISEYQDGLKPPFPDEGNWLKGLEQFLEAKGLLKRNPLRKAAAVKKSERQFLKAEKQFWRNLDLIVPRGSRAFHPGRGLIFNWARISDLLQSSP